MKQLVVVAAIVFASAGHARAQSPDAGEVAYTEGRRAYDLGEWDKAITKFKESYAARADAASLFNIAQSYRLKGDCAEAWRTYKAYRRTFPIAQNLAKVDEWIASLEVCAKQKGATAADPTATPILPDPTKPADPVKPVEPTNPQADPKPEPQPDPAPVKPMPPPPPRTSGKRIASYVLLGIGAAGVVFGALASVKGVGLGGDREDCLAMGCSTDALAAIEKDGKSWNTRAYLGYGIGGAALAGGIVLYLMSRKDAPTSNGTYVGIVPVHDGAVVTSAWRF